MTSEEEPLLEEARSRKAETASSAAGCCHCTLPSAASSGIGIVLTLLIVQGLERVTYYTIFLVITEYVDYFLDISLFGQSRVWVSFAVGLMYALSPIYGWISDAKLGHFSVLFTCFSFYLVASALIFVSAYIQDGSTHQLHVGKGLYYTGLAGLLLVAVPGVRATLTPFMLEQLTGGAEQRYQHLKAFVSWSYFAINVGGLCGMTVGPYLQSLPPPWINGHLHFIGFAWRYLLGFCTLVMALIILIVWRNQYKKYYPESITRPSIMVVCHSAWCRKPPRQYYDRDMLRQHQLEPGTEEESIQQQTDEHACRLAEMIPLMTTMIIYYTIYTQNLGTFVEQGRHLRSSKLQEAHIPPWDIPTLFDPLAVIVTVPLMQWVLKPLYERTIKQIISTLPSIRWGMVLAAFSCGAASLVDFERTRCCKFTQSCTKVNDITVCQCYSEMSVAWQVPQYVFMGMSEALAVVGVMEFVLSRSPREYRCTVFGFLHTIKGIGRYIGVFILLIVRKISSSWYYPERVPNSSGVSSCSVGDEKNATVYNYFVILCFLMIFNTVYYIVLETKYRKYTRYAPLQR
jgi:peptide/histidine transporter 3/4